MGVLDALVRLPPATRPPVRPSSPPLPRCDPWSTAIAQRTIAHSITQPSQSLACTPTPAPPSFKHRLHPPDPAPTPPTPQPRYPQPDPHPPSKPVPERRQSSHETSREGRGSDGNLTSRLERCKGHLKGHLSSLRARHGEERALPLLVEAGSAVLAHPLERLVGLWLERS